MNQYVIAIDQGTTSSRAIVFDHSGNIVSSGQMEHEQIFPQAGWVEHDPEAIWKSVLDALAAALDESRVDKKSIAATVTTSSPPTSRTAAPQPGRNAGWAGSAAASMSCG